MRKCIAASPQPANSVAKDRVRPIVLVLLGCFATGEDATGPIQNLKGMVQSLSDRYRFKVVGVARESDVEQEWRILNGIDQIPLIPTVYGARGLRRILNQTPHDALITSGFFDRTMTIPLLLMRKLGLVPRRRLMLAAHGEFAPAALALGSAKKKIWIAACSRFDLLADVALQATTPGEVRDIETALPFHDEPTMLNPVIRTSDDLPYHEQREEGAPLRVVFLSRIDRMKNLDVALEILSDCTVEVEFAIYGPITDERYWAACRAMIERMPSNVHISYGGSAPQDQVLDILARHDLFFLPTQGENFGHAIADALIAGTPLLISDRTPWSRVMEVGGGWALPLESRDAWRGAIDKAAGLNPVELLEMRTAARTFAITELANSDGIADTAEAIAWISGP